MKNSLLFLFCTCCVVASGQSIPFSLDLQQIDAPGLPAIHSFAKAQSGDKWLIVAGRVDGMHSFFPNLAFTPDQANNNIMVIDTSSWSVWQSSLFNVPYEIRQALSATNPEYYQLGNYLYVIGGYGYDSLGDVKKTFSTLTALDVDGLIDEIISGGNNTEQYIRQISDTDFTVTGGRIEKIGSKFFLIGGQNFSGLYTKLDLGLFMQRYTNSISSFDLNDDGVNLSVSNFSANIDTVNFHRRDLNTAPWISSNGEEGFALYGGVFQYDHNTPFQNPVYVTQSDMAIDFSFAQKMSQYQCPVIPIYDSVMNNMYTIFIAGMSLYYFDSATQTLKPDTMVPFIRDISILIHHADGTTEEVILPIQFPELGGANMEFFPNTALPRYDNGVFKLRSLVQSTLLGYVYGGITSNAGNEGTSSASNKVYRLLLQPDFGSGISELTSEKRISLHPNPADDFTQLILKNAAGDLTEVKIVDALNRVLINIQPPGVVSTEQRIRIETRNFPAGIYSVIATTDEQVFSSRLVIVR